MNTNRRDFIGMAAGALAFCGCETIGGGKSVTMRANPKPDFYWSYLVHFGCNGWRDVPLEEAKKNPKATEHYLTRCMADHVRFELEPWIRHSQTLKANGCNQVIIDLDEIMEFPSHPELAVKGSWTPEMMQKEIDRLRGMGFEVVPKINFSCCHDSWLKDYQRMISTSKYYEVCHDVINDIIDVFDHPRLFHIGFDEEAPSYQKQHLLAVSRQGDLWWHDLNYIVGCIQKRGVRAWMWSDYIWDHKDEFISKMSKDILQSNWYYGAEFDTKKLQKKWGHNCVCAYEWLESAGFDQVPTGANWSCDSNFGDTVKYCDQRVSKNLLKGYMMAPWVRPLYYPHQFAKAESAAQLMGAAINARKAK